MQHSYSNDDTCFRMDAIDEVTEEELDALLIDSEPFLKIPEQEEEVSDNFKELPLDEQLRIKTSIQDPPTDLEMKPLPEHLKYAFLEKDSLLLVIIFALLNDDEKKRLVSVLKNHKEAFAWKTSDIPGFYWRFIKDFSKISHLMTKLIEKDSVFDFNEECIKAFETLKKKLTNAPIMVSPDWSQPFKLMCVARNFAVGAVLGQREGKHFHPIHFPCKTLNNAQQN
ncbi:reverse transcriptase domain-containing protein [Tanacetum coccineum]